MEEKLRKFGIDIIGGVPWGTHICQFYETKEDLTDILVPYFKAGLENNEFCLWVTSCPLEIEDAKKALKIAVPDLDSYLEKGQIEVISYTDWFVTEGVFSSEKILNGWVEKLNHAFKNGHDGMRLSGNTSWLGNEDWNSFIEYKEKTDNLIGNYRIIALCTYPLTKCKVTEIIDVVLNHQFTLIKKEGEWERIESSKRKKAEEEAIQATKNWKYTFDSVPDLITIIDTEYRIIRANKAMATKLGVTPEECVGLTCYRVVHGTDEPPSFCPHLQLLNDGLEHTKEVQENSLGGDFIVSVSPLHDLEGKLTGCIHVARDINERKKAEEALQESEEKYRTIVETVNEGICVVDAEVRITYVNKKIAEMLGYAQEEMIGRFVWDFADEEGKLVLKKNIKKRLQGINENYELRLICKDGASLWTFVSAKAFFNTEGKFIGSISLLTDITERKKVDIKLKETLDNLEELVKARTIELEEAYNSLKESEGSLAEAQKMAHIGNWEWHIASDKAYWSKEMYRIFGLNTQELAPSFNEYLSYIHPDDKDYYCNAIKKAGNDKPFGIDYRIILANGEERTVHLKSEYVFNDENIPVRIKGIVQDITERKKAEEKIKTLVNAVESSDDAIITESLEGIITSWNKGAEQIYGYSAEEILGKDLSILEPGSLKGETKQLIEKLKQNEKIQRYRTLRLKKDGSIINVSITLSQVFDVSGKLVAISAIVRDITQIIKAEKLLAKAEDARKKEIHHRIKNNLQVISSLLDLQAEKFSDKEVLEAFRESQNRVLSMSLIHEELYRGEENDKLDFSIYLRKLAENLLQTYSLSNKNICLYVDLEENAFFNMDIAVPLGIIVNELISNSLKHAFQGRDRGEIQIKLCREKKNYETQTSLFSLTILDNGIGIPENIELGMLESLGLQLVSTLIDQLDGKIELRRVQGTEFRIIFNLLEK